MLVAMGTVAQDRSTAFPAAWVSEGGSISLRREFAMVRDVSAAKFADNGSVCEDPFAILRHSESEALGDVSFWFIEKVEDVVGREDDVIAASD